MRRLVPALVLVSACLAAAPAAAAAKLVARGSVEQVQVTGAKPRASVKLLDRRGRTVAAARAGSLGGVVFRDVKSGTGYRITTAAGRSAAFAVLTGRSAPPSTAIYGQSIPKAGYGYLATRDGTKLAINVHLPTPAGRGPYPTLVEYSGYSYARPGSGESSIAQIANLLGFAVVDVNMRGTGCSGGAFDYFEPLQGLDGYDVIETVARQPWVAHGKVGMMGVSYGGISQLFTAATRPPSLAAIAPLSVIDDTQTTLYPGGILNTGFALSWAKDRVHDAEPASKTGGQPWALERIQKGDKVCKANQELHPEAVDLLAKVRANDHYVPQVADPLAPISFVHKIDVPVYLACQWTDEQTGGHCPALVRRFTGTKKKWFTFTNGTHIDSLDPATFTRWYDFLKIYVAREAPSLPDAVRAAAPFLFKAAMGVDDVTLPPDPIQGLPSLEAARAAFEALPPVRVMFDNGAGGAAPGAPVAAFERTYATLPVPGTQAAAWYFGPDGTLAATPPATPGSDRMTWNPRARGATDFSGDTASGPNGLWTASPPYDWRQPPAGTAVSYVSAPLAADTTIVGAGAVETWIRTTAPSADLQATVSEVRPDGLETFVQSGWLRTSVRKLDPKKSTRLEPVLSLRETDDAAVPANTWTKITVPLYYQGHVYRTGSRLRVTISAAGGDQPVWAFASRKPRSGTPAIAFARSPKLPSRVLLPLVSGSPPAPAPLPPCPGLRGEPCRAYAPPANVAGPAPAG